MRIQERLSRIAISSERSNVGIGVFDSYKPRISIRAQLGRDSAPPSFTGFFLPKGFSAGLRLEHSGADLWNAFVRAHAQAQLNGSPEIQMDYFTRAIESLLMQGGTFDDLTLKLDESYWTRAVEESGYVSAQRSVVPPQD
jgi:hypothetical protein